MPTALFIGGYADGRWIDVPDGNAIHEVGEARGATVRRHIYRADSLHCVGDDWRVFVADGMTPREWIGALLRGYRRTANGEAGNG